MTMRLLLHSPPYADESAAGYLLRLFEINGEPWGRERFKPLGLGLTDFLTGASDAPVRRCTNVNPDVFNKTSARVLSSTRVTLAGETLHRDDWTTGARRWCPNCWRQDIADCSLIGRKPGWRVHRRFWWDAACVTTCPIHSVRLEAFCPVCNDPVRWDSGSLTMCRNRHSLLTCEPVPVASEHVRADAYVLGRLNAGPPVSAPFLDALTLREAHDVMERFGVAAIGGPAGALSKIDDDRHPETLSAGFAIAAGWPNGFGGLLDALATRPDVGLGLWGLDRVYGDLVWWARKIRRTHHGKEVLDAILAHHAKRTIVRGYSEAASFVSADTPVSVIEISAATGRSEETISAYLKAMGHWPERTRQGTPIILPRSVKDELVNLFEDSVGEKQIGAMLDVNRTQVRLLLNAGVFDPTPLHAKVGSSYYRYSRKAVEALLKRLAANAPTVNAIPEGLHPLGATSGRFNTGGLDRKISMILDGKVEVRARLTGSRGLKALLVHPEDFRRAMRAAEIDAVGIKDAKHLLGLGLSTLSAAVDAGLFERIAAKGVRGLIVTRRSVEAFRDTYIIADELARTVPTKPVHVIRVLADAGIKPVLSQEMHARSRATIYRRADIPADWRERYRERYGR